MPERTIPNDSGHTTSIWMDTAVPSFDGRDPPAGMQVCVIGAGMAGLSVAHALVAQGVEVVVLDDGPIAGGESARTSAHLASAIDDRFWRLEKQWGLDGARLAATSHAAAIDAIEANVRTRSIECGFRRVDGYLFAPDGAARDDLDEELALELDAARRAGLHAEPVDRAPLPFDSGPCLRFGQQAQFHPIAYLRELARAVVDGGGRIHTGVHVGAIEEGGTVRLGSADGPRLQADAIVDATNATISSLLQMPTRQAAYRTYVLALDIPQGHVAHALYWDTDHPYHYVRVVPGERGRETLLVGGEDHRTGHDTDPRAHWAELEGWARTRFPEARAVLRRWSGQVMEPADGLGLIGASPDLERVWIVTGDSGNGLTHAAIAGLLLPDLIAGREHEWAALYDPDRSRRHGLGTLVREAASSTVPYLDWFKAGELTSLDDLPVGRGAVIRSGVHLVAAYRDEHGECHLRNAKCPHLGGVVRWNGAERSWECPCHGSRFDTDGRVINGPAREDLEPVGEIELATAKVSYG